MLKPPGNYAAFAHLMPVRERLLEDPKCCADIRCWRIWEARNQKVWNDSTPNCAAVVDGARSFLEAWTRVLEMNEGDENLESADIVVISINGTQRLEWLGLRISWSETNAHVHQSFHFIGPIQTQSPSHHSSPVVSHYEHLLFIFCRHGAYERYQVTHHVETRELGRVVGGSSGGVAVAAEVRSHGSVALRR
nr:hypothetical protein Ahy_B01g055624 [Ipomoea batatas]